MSALDVVSFIFVKQKQSSKVLYVRLRLLSSFPNDSGARTVTPGIAASSMSMSRQLDIQKAVAVVRRQGIRCTDIQEKH